MTPKRSLPTLAAAVAVLALAVCAPAAPRTDKPAGDPGFRIDAPTEAKPYTHLNFRNKAANFQFAVMADRTGGVRAGIFEDAIRKLNRLQPEFVISVGDLIGGYTTDTVSINAQWDAFDKLVEEIEMPYFYVAGNHDISNTVMEEIYQKRRGPLWYHFVYHDVLFLVVNTEAPYSRLSDEQLAYFRKVLQDNPDPRWTMVFMHNPLWHPSAKVTEAERARATRWDKFEELLGDRPYTVVAGHLHNYIAGKRNDRDHLILATTGGYGPLRGARMYGEFDHVVWVTMSDDGPILTNIALDGILMPDFRTTATAALVEAMQASGVAATHIRADGPEFTSGTSTVTLNNGGNRAVHARVESAAPPPLRAEPEVIRLGLAAGETTRVAVAITAPEGTRTDDLAAPVMAGHGFLFRPDGEKEDFEITGRTAIGVDRVRPLKRAARPVVVDGDTAEWGELPHHATTAEPPDAAWKGPGDASFRWGAAYDDEYLYLAIRTRDDHVVLNPKAFPWDQDGVEFRIDARPDPERSKGRAAEDFKDNLVVLVAPSPDGDGAQLVFSADKLPAGTRVASAALPDGVAAEVAIPLRWLDDQQKTDWGAVRINACMHDHDTTAAGARGRHLFWRPDWRSERNVEGSGTFGMER